jgi:hypothetical protein
MVAGTVGARTLVLRAASVVRAPAALHGLELTLQESGDVRTLSLAAARIEVPPLGLSGTLDWHCPLAHGEDGFWSCSGPVSVGAKRAAAGTARLAARIGDGRIELVLDRDRGHVELAIPLGGDTALSLRARRVPLGWFNPALHRAWQGGALRGGTLDATLAAGDDGAVKGRYALAGLAFDSTDGLIAGDQLAVQGTLAVANPAAAARVEIAGEVHGGEVLFGPVYAALPKSPARFALDVQAGTAGRWQVSRAEWHDPGVLDVTAEASLDPAVAGGIAAASVEIKDATLPAAAGRYAGSWLGAHGFSGLATRGSMRASLALDAHGLDRFAAHFANVDLIDGGARFRVEGLDGDIDWAADGARARTTLGWRSAAIYRIALGPARATLHAADGALMLDQPLDIGVLGGHLILGRLALHPAAASGNRLAAGLAITGVSLPQLSHALDWPELGGTLGGAIPSIAYDGEVARLDGGLQLDVFDGTLDVTGLSLERPFGVAPSLGADIDFRQIDLELLTGAFSFGEITGRLDGEVHDLRLVDWKPTAFDAELRADSGGRISQRAVGSLSSVSGASGLGGGIQGAVLKLFDTFGYRRLGLGCRLAGNVCRMSGLDAAKTAGGGYTIVEGSGLPRITVVGFQRAVDWPTLVERLAAATSGRAPIVQ